MLVSGTGEETYYGICCWFHLPGDRDAWGSKALTQISNLGEFWLFFKFKQTGAADS